MKRRYASIWSIATLVGVTALGCSSKAPGPGTGGTDDASVTGVTPPSAYLGRTLDLTIAGKGTSWSDKATVAFSDPGVKVNSVTAKDATTLTVNVTVGADASPSKVDVTVTEGSAEETGKAALELKNPLKLTIEPSDGAVPQGGVAKVHAEMLDESTPIDPASVEVTLSSSDIGVVGVPIATDKTLDILVQVDVLAKTGAVDMLVSSGTGDGAVASPVKKALSIAARSPTALQGGHADGGLKTTVDTALYQYVGKESTFLQVSLTLLDSAGLVGAPIPQSGRWADAPDRFFLRHAAMTAANEPLYVVLLDSGNPDTAPPPYSYALEYTATKVTPAQAMMEGQSGNDDTPGTANTVSSLPALVTNGALGYDGVDAAADVDYYKFTVSGASADAPKSIHLATGGDGKTVTMLGLLNAKGEVLDLSLADDNQADLLVEGISEDGDYFAMVTVGEALLFDPKHTSYQLFIDVE